ncbi:YceI family protein [Algoriphagus yeomjeoni]|uniref:YceI-like domain-containing protein n=1 Tax=Algoriphagus yeomjeoni TaxID=291403 RepID=A0A327PZ11_9BACT|nr:YceI family protein [Algoriphagus yeomjeoni]RAI94876.1 YceI-like domain-containing protein [Algoriphagus yeomjeoni]
MTIQQLILIFNLVFISLVTPKEEVINWKITSDSLLEILGTTNVSKFQCENYSNSGAEYLTQRITANHGEVGQWNGEVLITSTNFDCNNSLLTRDFKKTIEVDQYPTIKVKFLSLTKGSETANQSNLTGKVEITLVGISKQYPISCVFLAKDGDTALFSGERKILLSDFNIEAPVKFLGTVKVQDSVMVNFSLVLEKQN